MEYNYLLTFENPVTHAAQYCYKQRQQTDITSSHRQSHFSDYPRPLPKSFFEQISDKDYEAEILKHQVSYLGEI